ncbi:unnamed protein product [Somion occarium]|uniref:Vacuolar sorting protein 39/Transforming growth factor beta receptor-associated domain-containing protein n=1 Tax=Somion occarium TaxID=3059160 RepID=A0ABP1CT24_9APHY
MKSSTSRSNVLVLGSNAVYSLLPSTLIAQVEALLDAHRIEDAVDMADQQRRKVEAQLTVDEEEADELRYVYQRIGFQCFAETLFDDAGRHLFHGELDPRALISYYPEYYDSLFHLDESIDLFSGVAERMPTEESIDDIIRNYSPHLAPNTRTAPPAVELRAVLKMAATDMLRSFLRKWRRKRRLDDPGGTIKPKALYQAVDTVLARLYVESDEKSELLILIHEPNDILMSEVEPALVTAKWFNALCQLYQIRGEDAKLLDVWSRLAAGEWIDPEVEDPLSNMFTFLNEKKDRALIRQWGVWLTKQDSERAIKLLTSGRKHNRQEDDFALLQQIQESNPAAALQFLEHLVLRKRSQNAALHVQLATLYVDQLLSCVSDEATSKLWRAKVSSYSSSQTNVPFLSYFASTTPDSDSKRTRLKTILFLQASELYDVEPIRTRLQDYEKLLSLELSIVEGKLGHDRSALSILVHTLHDSSSAEAYCTLGGEVVPAKTAQSLGERFSLQSWAALFVPPVSAGKAKSSAAFMKRQKSVSEERKRELTRILLEVYMSGGEAMSGRTAQLLAAQGMNLDVVDVSANSMLSFPQLNVLPGLISHTTRMATPSPLKLPRTFIPSHPPYPSRRPNHQVHRGKRESRRRRADLAHITRARCYRRGGG